MNIQKLEEMYKVMCGMLGKECDTELLDEDGKFKNIELHEPLEDNAGWNTDETMMFDFAKGEFTNSDGNEFTGDNLLQLIEKYAEEFVTHTGQWVMVLKHIKMQEDVK